MMSEINFPHSILIAEDEKVTRDVLGIFLINRYPDAVTHFAENGEIGVELFRKYMPDIVITDIRMPVKDGIRMAEEIRAIKAGAKIIAVSAYCDYESLRERLEKIRFEEFLRKPLDFTKLFMVIDNCAAEG
jgi:two-component system, sensor histidine kinase and response regulator